MSIGLENLLYHISTYIYAGGPYHISYKHPPSPTQNHLAFIMPSQLAFTPYLDAIAIRVNSILHIPVCTLCKVHVPFSQSFRLHRLAVYNIIMSHLTVYSMSICQNNKLYTYFQRGGSTGPPLSIGLVSVFIIAVLSGSTVILTRSIQLPKRKHSCGSLSSCKT